METPRLLSSTAFYLGVLGARWEESFAAALEIEDVKPKHVAMLAILRDGTPSTQQDLALVMGIAPSLVVALADNLEAKGAVRRERDVVDRRRQRLVLAQSGIELLQRCESIMAELDAVLDAALAEKAPAFRAALELLAAVETPPKPPSRT
jgi:DNA-binding MarR family transcriptional regulator